MASLNIQPLKQCSVVIPTKNGGGIFQRVLHGLQKQINWSQVELIIIDSGSTDGTVQAARNVGAKVIEIPPQDFNHGATRDYGISLTTCEIVVLMVQDAIPNDPHLLQNIIQRFGDLEVAGVYVRQLPQPDADLLTKRNLNNWLTGRAESETRKMTTLDWFQSLEPIAKYFFCNFDNVCSAVRKSVWQRHMFGRINFGEDVDWAERVLKAGFKIVYESGVAVIHSHDRPLSYEYKRTYVCHRKLYRQFGLQLVPNIKGLVRAWISSTIQDARYVFRQNVPVGMKLDLVMKIPVLNFLSAVAQYRAARDEAAGNTCNVRGV